MRLRTFLLGLLLILIYPPPVHAVCPLCTFVVAGGLGISRWIGIDDSVTGVWIGGLILSSALWLASWIKKGGWKISYPELISLILMVLFVIPPLYWLKMVGLPKNTLWGVDKILLGTGVGFFVFLSGVVIDKYLRTVNEDKVLIYYQKVIIPVFLLTLTSFVFYLVTG